ncbi:hypothetical protein D3C74_370720 [compost metagenome]
MSWRDRYGTAGAANFVRYALRSWPNSLVLPEDQVWIVAMSVMASGTTSAPRASRSATASANRRWAVALVPIVVGS